jgi:hypothetical protein
VRAVPPVRPALICPCLRNPRRPAYGRGCGSGEPDSVWEGASAFRRRGRVIAWLLGIVHHKAVDILRGIDLQIGSGMFGLLGPNGAGKTTVIRILAGIVSPGAGSVRINEYDLASGDGKSAVKTMLGYLPQELGLDPELTARQPGTTDPRGGGQGVDGRQRGSLPPDDGCAVVSMMHMADGIQYRLVGDPPRTHPQAEAAPPGLEDGYVWLMRKEGETVLE